MVYFMLYPMIAFTLNKINKLEQNMIEDDHHVESDVPQVKFVRLFLIRRFTMGVMANILVFTTVTFLQPTLSLHLTEHYHYQPMFIGFSFAVPTLIYAASSPLVYLLT
jgi:hypothetical protein